MIVTTTGAIEGREIREYRGIVFGEVISGVNVFNDIKASFRNVFGGRSESYEGELLLAREQALNEMSKRAMELGANAIIGVKMDYEVLGANGSMLMVTCSGTAVILN